MSIFPRARNILLRPQTEWAVISHETATPQSLLRKYVICMALIPAVAIFIAEGLIAGDYGPYHVNFIGWGLTLAIINFLVSILGYFVSVYITDALGPSLGASRNIGDSAKLIAYSLTAYWVAGIFFVIPTLTVVGAILSLYSIYLLYTGAGVMLKVSEDKRVLYTLVIFVVVILVGYVVERLVSWLAWTILGSPFGDLGNLHDMYWR